MGHIGREFLPQLCIQFIVLFFSKMKLLSELMRPDSRKQKAECHNCCNADHQHKNHLFLLLPGQIFRIHVGKTNSYHQQ